MRRRRHCCALGAVAVALLSGCSAVTLDEPVRWQPSEASTPSSFDGSLVCQGLAQRFLGLPTTSALPWKDAAPSPAPSAGRWWVRSCEARTMGAELEIRLQGPGWYWVDETGSSLRVLQQVPFELELALRGQFQMAIESGVLSLAFRPSAEPFVRLQSPPELAVRSVNVWGALLRVVPGASPQRRAAERFHREASEALRARLRAGASFTYVLSAGQADATLGQLPPGETPRRPFGESTWVINERLLLGPGAVQVVGPIEPSAKQLNVIVERGSGIGYRAICDSALRDHFRAIQHGQLEALPGAAWSSGGNVSGSGEHTIPLIARGCPYFLVTWSLKEDYTLADILVRS